MDYGTLTLNIERILKARGISKNQICKDLDIGLICKLCWYLEIDAGELIEYRRPEKIEDVK